VVTACHGITSVASPCAVDADTLFQIGSTTKTLTATALLRLCDHEQLELDRPICEILPELTLRSAEAQGTVTMRHLLTHTPGWEGDYFVDTGRGDDALAGAVAGMVGLRQITPPGSIWSYCNSGFYVAGRVLEVLTGCSYEQAVDEFVLRPLQMSASVFFADQAITRRVAVGHGSRGGEPVVTTPWQLPRCANPIGGLISSLNDQVRYAGLHLVDPHSRGDEPIVRSSTLRMMQEPQVSAGGSIDAMGLSWMLRDVCHVRVVSHGGTTNGQTSVFLLVPERQFALIIMTNAEGGSSLGRELTAWALETVLGLHEAPVDEVDVDMAAFAGTYTSALSRISLSSDGRGLLMRLKPLLRGTLADIRPRPPAPPPVRLRFVGQDTVEVLDEPMKRMRADFVRDTQGAVRWFRFGGRLAERLP
jgi:CubicO group peptidase (beta-lactamase class C family)